jgi:hypothetical protein
MELPLNGDAAQSWRTGDGGTQVDGGLTLLDWRTQVGTPTGSKQIRMIMTIRTTVISYCQNE